MSDILAYRAPLVGSDRWLIPILKGYLALTKPRIAALITFTALVGEFLASRTLPPLSALCWGTLGIALSCACAATLNQLFERGTDADMSRTRARPLPSGQLSGSHAFLFAVILGSVGLSILALLVNVLTAILTFATLIGYGLVYTLWLKRLTSQNIVIGGLAGAAPPVLGWAAVTNEVTLPSVLLALIIFLWTPPHFWALAIARRDEYARAGIPMLPVTHGVRHTKRQMLYYTMLLIGSTIMPFVIHMSGLIYLCGALLLDGIFLAHVLRLNMQAGDAGAMGTFKCSVQYLLWLFAALLADHYLTCAQ